MTTIVHFNGYSLAELAGGNGAHGDWEHVCWGDPATHRMGRIPTAIDCALKWRADRLIWSTGATRTKSGEYEAQYSLRIALERADQYAADFPAQFSGRIDNVNDFRLWLERISYLDCDSVNTATSMEVVIPVIDRALAGRPGTLLTVSSANHVARAMRDAVSIWQHGIVLERAAPLDGAGGGTPIRKRTVTPLHNRHLVTIAAVAAGTSYADGCPSDTLVDDLGRAGPR